MDVKAQNVDIIDEESDTYKSTDKYKTDYVIADNNMNLAFFHIIGTDNYLVSGGCQLVALKKSYDSPTWSKTEDPAFIKAFIKLHQAIIYNFFKVSDIYDDNVLELFQKAYEIEYFEGDTNE